MVLRRELGDGGAVRHSPEQAAVLFAEVRREALGPVAAMLEEMWTDALWHLKLKAELKESRRGPRPRRQSKGKKR